ncbi:NAD dependent epimerase/dehydratase family protein [Myroides guanonis]|uniref:NAD dependent epimerase/dehydratase family protein n=2 Tax=Myroides guanonis TaxID=1150112 RepID=A0A1I3KUQ0_9FLAO|nr:NAD dependent epimerase/dehydratase family protein [Myroides guanonis]
MTGITGLLGTNLANKLLEQGYHVTALARNPEKYTGKYTNQLNLVSMHLEDDYDFYLNKIDIVIHIAAETRTNLLTYAAYEKVNYEATIRLFEKSIKHNILKFVFISTANTIGYGNLEFLGTETQKIKEPFDKLYYAQSKLKAEEYLLSHQTKIGVTILNPTFMIGPYDSKPSSGKIILMGMNKRWVFYPPGGKNFVAVNDVVDAIFKSFNAKSKREKYLIAGENLSYKAFFKKLNHNTKQRTVLIPIPKILLLSLGVFGNFLRFCKIKTSLHLVNMKTLCIKNYYSNHKSINDLNVQYSPLDNAITESVNYFRERQMI